MNTLPLFFNLQDKTVLIVGGGDVALRKAALIQSAGAKIHVIAKTISDELTQLLQDDKHQCTVKAYETSDLTGEFAFCVVATNDDKLNEQIYHDCQAINLAVNVVDNLNLCDFIFPAIVDRSPVVIGVSSNGKAPVLSRLIRAKLESVLPSGIGELAKKAGEFRQTVKDGLPTLNQRRYFWEKIFNHALQDKPIKPLADELSDFVKNAPTTGEVYIVGAGAGDPDLLTFKALRLMQQADVVLYDALVSDEILALCRRDSDKIFVGKKRREHSKSQDDINQMLINYAKQGKRVLRLKGGDPFVFGRGGEEMIACQQAGVPYQVVNGITSALAAAAVGIPLTHRGLATSVRFLTACYQAGDNFDGLKSTYHSDETLVFYMGLHALDNVVENLSQDLSAQTPIAIISNASLPSEQVLIGTLGDIVQQQAKANLPAPAIIIVGKVVGLYQGKSYVCD